VIFKRIYAALVVTVAADSELFDPDADEEVY